MSNRSRIVLGSLAGAFAIHIAALACSSNTGTGGPPDASTADAGHVEGRDGGVLDAIASVFDAVGDVVHDVATKITDGEVRDANAGGDAGVVPVRTCDCVPPVDDASFTAVVDFQGRTLTPEGPFSTASGRTSAGRNVDGSTRYSVSAGANFFLSDGYIVRISCSATTARRDHHPDGGTGGGRVSRRELQPDIQRPHGLAAARRNRR
nr:hypothetical protein [Deltaproteobacteria bacterium]